MDVHLIVGLGNPGAEYENTYHNAGALALAAIATALSDNDNLSWEVHKKLFSYLRTSHWIFVRPLTFMNESGAAVREAVRKFNVSPENIILLHDDSDLSIGTWKISRKRGAAGHHGAESVTTALGTDNITRIRIGIRPKDERVRKKAGEFVLRKITKANSAIFKKTFTEMADAASHGRIIP
jgi:PTH1 family peptidyl-tRNA hydrolase